MDKKTESIVLYKGKKYPKYTVNTSGVITNVDTGRELKPFDDDRGYDCVDLMDNAGNKCRAKVHLIVAHTFIGKQKADMIVQHKNGNKKSNKLSNLEYITQQENVAHAQTKIRGLTYLSDKQRDRINKLREEGKTLNEIADIMKINMHVVRDFLNGKTYN